MLVFVRIDDPVVLDNRLLGRAIREKRKVGFHCHSAKPHPVTLDPYRVGHYEAIRTILRSWIPRISILGPEDFRKAFLEEVKGWVERESGILV